MSVYRNPRGASRPRSRPSPGRGCSRRPPRRPSAAKPQPKEEEILTQRALSFSIKEIRTLRVLHAFVLRPYSLVSLAWDRSTKTFTRAAKAVNYSSRKNSSSLRSKRFERVQVTSAPRFGRRFPASEDPLESRCRRRGRCGRSSGRRRGVRPRARSRAGRPEEGAGTR